MSFLWTTVHVKDIEASRKFYEEIVGLTVDRCFVSPTGRELCFLGDSETKIELIYGPDEEVQSFVGSISIGFAVDSVEEKFTFVKEKGIEPISEIMSPNPTISFFYVADPNGLKVQFCQIK